MSGVDPLLLPGVLGAGAAHAAHHLVEDQQRTVAVADRAHRLEIAGQRRDAAGGRPHHRLGDEGGHGIGAEALERRFQLVGQTADVIGIALARLLEAIGEAGRDVMERRRQDRRIGRAAHHVAAGRERAQRGAVVALPPRDEIPPLTLAALDEILPRQLQRRLRPLRAGRAEIGVAEAARIAVEQQIGERLGRLAGEKAGMRIRHALRLCRDRAGDAPVAVAEAGDRSAAGAVDDFAPVREAQIDAVAGDGGGRGGSRAVQNVAHRSMLARPRNHVTARRAPDRASTGRPA